MVHLSRGVGGSGGPGGARAPRNLADQLTLFKPRGAHYARHATTSPPPPRPPSPHCVLKWVLRGHVLEIKMPQ